MAEVEVKDVNVFLVTLDSDDMLELERLIELWKTDIKDAVEKVIEAGLY